jgi:hypothetical protein
MVDKLTLDDLRALAERVGLELGDDELKRLLPGVNRSRQQVAELRELLTSGDEPASTFDAGKVHR